MTPPNPAPSPHPIEARVCHVPYQPVSWRPEPPTVASWRFLKDHCNVTGVRLQYLYDDPRWWDAAIGAAIDGGMEIHANVCLADASKPVANFEFKIASWMLAYGSRLKSVSFGNEPGYALPDDDISKGGTRDYMKEYVDNFWLSFIRGVRRANPNIIIGGPDAESADTLQRFVNLVDVDQWFVHNYGEREVSEGDGLDFATMAGKNGKLGFNDVRVGMGVRNRPLIISEIDLQQLPSAKARGEFRGVATDDEIGRLTAFSVRMRDEFHAPVITFGTAEYFYTRVPVVLDWPPPDPPRDPPYTWSTWAHGTPELSEAGKRLAAVFAPVKPVLHGRPIGRRG